MKKLQASVGTSADMAAGVKISQVYGGYFSDAKNAETFCEIGIKEILPNLPKKITLIDFGGGEGFLTKHVRDYLISKGYEVEASVLDANFQYIEIAKSEGLSVILSSIQDSNVKNTDLIIARAVIHYNPAEMQQSIFNKIFDALKNGGYFIHQLTSGSKENCKLRSDLVNIKSLHRAADDFKYKWISEKECIRMLKKAGFKENFVAGYAKANAWGPQEQWERFNKNRTDEAKLSGDKILLEKIEKEKEIYLTEANNLVKKYLAKYKNRDNDIKKIDEVTYLVEYPYPIIISRK
jgi:hypothetical protein